MLQIGRPLENDCWVGKQWCVLQETDELRPEDIVIDQGNAKRKARFYSQMSIRIAPTF